ncbi:MAG: GNAT family N-acetyltransferase [Candidatus Diapherotrites archaeon]|nr:GNAT family N-acetyltransferase [Candidatus Diapherotrites archaeon]
MMKDIHSSFNPKIVLPDGKAYPILRLRGNNPKVSKLLWEGESDKTAREYQDALNEWGPGTLDRKPDYTSMFLWFMKESHANSNYVCRYALQRESEVFFVLGADKKPIAFFSILHGKGMAYLGTMYVKKKYRGVMGNKSAEGIAMKLSSTGQRLVEYALRVARRMGHTGLVIPQMTLGMEIAQDKAGKNQRLQRIIASRIQEANEMAGDDALIEFNKRQSRSKGRRLPVSQSARFSRRLRK